MKTSLRRWRGFTLHKHGDSKDRRDLRPLAQLDELAQASQDMQDMRGCYDSLLSAAAATANSAYEFSESLQELGACLLEKTALNDNEESGKVLLMLGKVQFELQKLVDAYRSHIFQTITIPSESLLNELQTVEEMKRQCDEKRNVCEYMLMRQREKGRSKNGKGETFSLQQLQEAHDEYDQEATLFVFRLKSLKQGQSRSLLTQAARHHAAQLSFVKKALKSLEAVDPHVKMVAEQQHIDYQFRGLEDDDMDDGDDDDNGSDSRGDGELSFDYRQNEQEQDAVSSSRKSMELDQPDITFSQVARLETSKETLDRNYRKSLSFSREVRFSSQSAPLFMDNKSDLDDRRKQMRQSSTRKFNTYVLPTPGDTKSSHSPGPGSPVPSALRPSLGGDKTSKDTAQSILRESNNNTASIQLPPPPPADGFLLSRLDPRGASVPKKVKRQSFSGPLTGPRPAKPVLKEHQQLLSGPLLRNPMPQPPSSSPKVSPSTSPTFVSSPKISELHELPRPPGRLNLNSARPMGLVGHSAPLLPKGQVLSAPSKSAMENVASPLPKPPQTITRSFSIPSSSHEMETAHNLEMASPPLTPISLTTKNPSSAVSEPVVQTVEIRGAE